MCDEQAQKQYAEADAPTMGYAAGPATMATGQQFVRGSRPDPMWMPLSDLITGWHRQAKELSYLRIEVSRHKLRIAELEYERAMRIG